MAQITVYAQSTPMNWDDADGWNTVAGGGGDAYTNPQNGGGNTFICVLNGKAVTANVDITVDQINAPATDAGKLTISATRVITANITYGHTLTAGMVVVPTGTNLTVVGQATNNGAGYHTVIAGTGVLTISNAGGTAISVTAGRGVESVSTGSNSITGAVVAGGVYGWFQNAAGPIAATGNLSVSAGYGFAMKGGLNLTGDVVVAGGCGMVAWVGGNITINGNLSTTGAGMALEVSGGTVNWTGSRSLAASANCYLLLASGTLNLATASANLLLANSGSFVLRQYGGTLNTADAGAGAAGIVLQTATSYAAILGGTDAQKAIITGPTLPAANDVLYGSGQFGYAGSLLTPNYAGPCNGQSPYTPDASKVLVGAYFGVIGSLTQGTFDEAARNTDPGEGNVEAGIEYIIQSAEKEGTFVVPAEADVKDGVFYGAGGTEFEGTYVGVGGGAPFVIQGYKDIG